MHWRERLLSVLTLELAAVLLWLVAILLTAWRLPLFLEIQRLLALEAAAPAGGEIFLAFVIALIILIFFHKQTFFATIVSILLSYMTFSGALLFMGTEAAFLLAVSILLYQKLSHTFLSNNLLVAAGVLFGAIPIALGFEPVMVVFILAVFSVYDVIGVFLTKFIPTLAHRAVQYELPLIWLAPRAHVSWHAIPSSERVAAMMGAGDVFLPAIFITSVTLAGGVPMGLLVLFGAVIGWTLNNFLSWIVRGGIPAMPLLAVGMIAAYYLAL